MQATTARLKAESVPQYQYQPLQHKDSLRLLKLLPGSPGSPLRCRLIECISAHSVGYEALSYTWDAPVFPHVIHVECNPSTVIATLAITENLYHALQTMRYTTTHRLLWVDAICINQNDPEEKGHQVARMGATFQEAGCVRIWLGTPTSKDGLQAVEDITRCRDKLIGGRGVKVDGLSELLINLTDLEETGLLSSSWFTRIWTVQEFVLAKHAWFHFGSFSCESDTLELALDTIDMASAMSRHRPEDPNSGRVVTLQASLAIDSKLSLFKLRQQYRQKTHWNLERQFDKNSEFPAPSTLARCVTRLSRHRACSDPRDRVYGMLGVANDISLRPDYHMPPQTVFLDFAAQSLSSGDFTLLHEYDSTDHITAEHFLLSVFFPRSRERFPIWSDHPNQTDFEAGHASGVDVSFDDKYNITFRGVMIDEVRLSISMMEMTPLVSGIQKSPKPSWPSYNGHLAEIYYNVLTKLYDDHTNDPVWLYETQQIQESPIETWYPRFSCSTYPERVLDVVMKTIAAGAPPHDLGPFETNQALPHSYSLPTKLHISLQRDHQLFRTKRGYLGLASTEAQPGDVVAIFDGAKTPFILRRDRDCYGHWHGKYRLLGDCYAHGWMDGSYFGHSALSGEDTTQRWKGYNKKKSRKMWKWMRGVAEGKTLRGDLIPELFAGFLEKERILVKEKFVFV